MKNTVNYIIVLWSIFATMFAASKTSISTQSGELNCPENNQWESNFTKCFPDFGTKQQNVTRDKCAPLLSHSIPNNGSITKLPECYNATLSLAAILNLTYDRRQEFINASNQNPAGQLLTTCFPIAETLRKCQQRIILDFNNYIYSNESSTLMDNNTMKIYQLGQYFTVSADNDKFLTEDEQEQLQGCAEPYVIICNGILPNQKRFCNYIQLSSEKYNKTSQHNGLYLPWRNETLPFAEYEEIIHNPGSLNVCYPLSKSMKACQKVALEQDEVIAKDGFKLLRPLTGTEYDIGDYHSARKNGVAVCQITYPEMSYNYKPHAVLCVISAVCLFAVFIIHLIVPSINYHAKPLLCHVFSMMVMYIGLATSKFLAKQSTSTCYTLFILIHYFSLASFFWLNVLAFDLWRVFAKLNSRIGAMSRITCTMSSCNNTRFYIYCTYAWGFPLLITAATIFVDQVPEAQEVLRIQVTITSSCWLFGFGAPMVFFYGPIALIIFENLIFFLLTIWNLRQISNGADLVNKKVHKQLLTVFIKLFVVMGLSWIIELTSWAVGWDVRTWYIPDIVTTIQGIFIFIIYICKPTAFKLLRDKFIRSAGGKWIVDDSTNFKTQQDLQTSNSFADSTSFKQPETTTSV